MPGTGREMAMNKSLLVLLAAVFAILSCRKQVQRRAGNGDRLVVETGKNGEIVKQNKAAELAFQDFLIGLGKHPEGDTKAVVASELLKLQLAGTERSNKSPYTESGRCMLISEKAFTAKEQQDLKDELVFVGVGQGGTLAYTRSTTLQATDCVRYFKGVLGFRFETHYMTQFVAFFSYGLL
jgi:hypothetical protein